ncbi:hypothetical protein DPMN_060714 [Dreissena polymorpha]|uniref:Uncharacterized protein n=1 Tax=Dreissena polymorpha TaxID=45954 RepID=A0A9D4HHU2_DREPO|nr:hypothetical protein DPMN_060714 [Dreissena polymorpha]
MVMFQGELGQFLRSEVTILANDDPYGKFVFPTAMRPVFVNESNQCKNLLESSKSLMRALLWENWA